MTLSLRHLLGSAFLALTLVLGATAGVYWLTLRYASEVPVPALHRLILAAQEGETESNHAFVQQNLDAMAVKLGEMQAQPRPLAAVGERLSTMAGVRDVKFAPTPGIGGARPAM